MSNYVIVDLEMCRVPKGFSRATFHRASELIEIGAVLLSDTYEIVDSFKTFVAPEFGEVDAYIQNLTGITKADTRNAPSTEEALKAFVAWLPEDAILVSWSDNDEIQIRKELEYKHIDIPGIARYLDTWQDCQKTFSEKMDSPMTYRLSEALIIADIDYDENIHDALVDAKNTALLFAKMQREPKLTLNAYLKTEETATAMFTPFAGLLEQFKCAV